VTTETYLFNRIDILRQFTLLVIINTFVGGMIGLERTVLPLIAEADFGITSKAAAISFIVSFGLTKALVNLAAGTWADRWGRKRILLMGWVAGIPVPFLIMFATNWVWIVLANVLLGVNQALAWSMTLVMKIDLAGDRRRGLAIGLNEFAGYTGLAVLAAASAFVATRYGLRPEPFYLGVSIVFAGLVFSLFVRETSTDNERKGERFPARTIFRQVSFSSPTLSRACVGGLVVNLKDGVLWGLMPMFLVSKGLPVSDIGMVVAVYPATWGLTQILFGTVSDRIGRKTLITIGFGLQGMGIIGLIVGQSLAGYLLASSVIGLGTAMVYPTLIALVTDETEASWRATALGAYRFWRDLGYAVGALGAGIVADVYGVPSAMIVTVGLIVFVTALFASMNYDPARSSFGHHRE